MTKAKQLFIDFRWNIEFDSMIGGLVVQDLRVNITLSLEKIDKWLTPKTKESLMKDLASSTKPHTKVLNWHDSIYREEILTYT